MPSEEILFFNEESIDPERIISDDYQDFLCPICMCLVWKPRSCTLCQNLFCRNCIQTWLNGDSITCPLCRAVYEDKPVSSLAQSILSHYSIRCRNASLGCKKIFPYNLLEQHENFHCKYPTKKCRICEQIVLVTDLDQHKNICKPIVIQCCLCGQSIKTELFQRHQDDCLRRYSNPSEPFDFDLFVPEGFVTGANARVNTVGIEIFDQSRQKNCLTRFYALIQFMFINLPIVHLLLLTFFGWGCENVFRALVVSFRYFQSWIRTSIYQAFLFIIIFNIIFNHCLLFLLQSVHDMFIISFIIFSLIIWSPMSSKPRVHQFNIHFNLGEFLLFSTLIFLFSEMFLLIIRFYLDYIPIYIGVICLTFSLFWSMKDFPRE